MILLAVENSEINKDGATEGDLRICVVGQKKLLCNLYEAGITEGGDDNLLHLIHKKVMNKLNFREIITALESMVTSESSDDNAAEQEKE